MATSIELQSPRSSGETKVTRTDLNQSSKKRKRSTSLSLDYGIATPPKSPLPTSPSFLEADTPDTAAPSPIQQPSPHSPLSPDASTNLLTLIRNLKAKNPTLEVDVTFSVTPTAFAHFETALRDDGKLERFLRRRVKWEWDPVRGTFRILAWDGRAEEICRRVLRDLEGCFAELASAKHTLHELDSWGAPESESVGGLDPSSVFSSIRDWTETIESGSRFHFWHNGLASGIGTSKERSVASL